MRPLYLALLLVITLVITVAADARASSAAESAPHAKGRAGWCAPEMETLPDDVCHVDANEATAGSRRTLVVFLHGLVPRSEPWQWTQQRAILREARYFHFAAIMPKGAPVGVNGSGGFAWPGNADDAKAFVDQWAAAQRRLEARAGKPFDEVFVVGFSSGAYFAASLAAQDRMKADGYVLLAGGKPIAIPAETTHRAPIFIGVSARDRFTAPAARALGAALRAKQWPVRVNEQPVGHMVSDLHMVRALAYLRAQTDESRARVTAR